MKYLALIVLALLQIGASGWLIADRECVLAKGQEVKFVTRPADPYDPFRGRYVALSFQAEAYESESDLKLPYRVPLYAVFEVDADGYASVSTIQQEPPTDESAIYVKLESWWFSGSTSPRLSVTDAPKTDEKVPERYRYNLRLPFNRYYMNENAAPDAENRYRQANRPGNADSEAQMTRDNYLTVRILNGRAVAEQLFIEGKPIEQLLGETK